MSIATSRRRTAILPEWQRRRIAQRYLIISNEVQFLMHSSSLKRRAELARTRVEGGLILFSATVETQYGVQRAAVHRGIS